MARFCGFVGFSEPKETEPGIWEEQITEKPYRGDVIKDFHRYQKSDGVNDNINIANNISIISDPYANTNFQHIRYVVFMGAKWSVISADVQYPRIILTLGGVYHGN